MFVPVEHVLEPPFRPHDQIKSVHQNTSNSFALNQDIKFSMEQPLLCISTSERVLCMLFAGQNQIFNAETTFWVLLIHKMYKIMQKITKNLGFTGVYQLRKSISTSERRAEYPFAGQKTQQTLLHICYGKLCSSLGVCQ